MKKKKCSKCKKRKSEKEFSKKGKGLQPYCKECHKTYRRAHYLQNRKHLIGLIRKRRKALQQWLRDWKAEHKCERCPEDHPACLDFHHKDPKSKEGNMAEIAHSRGWGIERMKKEISKCLLLCANCHRKLHWKEKRP